MVILWNDANKKIKDLINDAYNKGISKLINCYWKRTSFSK